MQSCVVTLRLYHISPHFPAFRDENQVLPKLLMGLGRYAWLPRDRRYIERTARVTRNSMEATHSIHHMATKKVL